MSVVAVVGLSIAAGVLVLVLRHRALLAWAAGLVGLLVVAGAAARLGPGIIALGSATLELTPYGRSLIAAIAVAGLLLGLVAAAVSAPVTVAAALLLGIGAVAIALAGPDPLVGLWAVLGGAVATLGVGLLVRGPIDRPGPSADAIRAVGGASALGVIGVALAAPPLGSPAPDAGLIGLAYLAVAAALGIRMAAVPVHRWAARLADSTPIPLVAPTLVWLPVALALVVIGWEAGPVTAAGLDLGPERTLVVAVGLATVLLGTVAALVQDDLGHASAYLVIADGGLALVAFGTSDAAALAAAQTWLLVLAATKTALVAWLAALEAAHGTRRLPDLEGWARRAPGLALAFAVVAIATIGWPGSAALSARLDLARVAIAGPAGTAAGLALLAVALPYCRILLVGFRRPDGLVDSSPGGLLRRLPRWEVTVASGTAERLRAAGRDARAVWAAERRPVASVAVMALALVAVTAAAGGLGVGSAAGAAPSGAAPAPAAAAAAGSPARSSLASPVPSTDPSRSVSSTSSAAPPEATPAPSPGASAGSSGAASPALPTPSP